MSFVRAALTAAAVLFAVACNKPPQGAPAAAGGKEECEHCEGDEKCEHSEGKDGCEHSEGKEKCKHAHGKEKEDACEHGKGHHKEHGGDDGCEHGEGKGEDCGCDHGEKGGCEHGSKHEAASGPQASATVQALGTSGISGELQLSVVDGGVRVSGTLRGLPPGSTHGMHIHEKGDCSAPDGSSAGGHFNPGGHQHGAPGAGSHVGDLGNVTADATGVALVNTVSPGGSLGGGGADVAGKSVVVHKDADDLKSQPAGNSGARVACGVITLTK